MPRKAAPLVHAGGNVYDAARGRMRWLFEEFEGNICVGTSGGKDSTVVAELAIETARELGCLPVKMWWLDQECEYESTVRYQRWMADRPETDFRWYQVPFKLFNAANHDSHWLNVWGEGEEWVRDKEPDSIHTNDFWVGRGEKRHLEERFKPVLNQIGMRVAEGGAVLSGLRAEESPARRLTLTTKPYYKWATWSAGGTGNADHPDFYRFSPIYDWTYIDVWKAIEMNGWRYNDFYDQLFRYGGTVHQMRVSNYHHETATNALHYLQEIEPDTWEAATKRLAGLAAYTHQTAAEMRIVRNGLPYMFASWYEYFCHLVNTLIPDEASREKFHAQYRRVKDSLPGMKEREVSMMMCRSVVANDVFGTKADNFVVTWRKVYNDETFRKKEELRARNGKVVVEWAT